MEENRRVLRVERELTQVLAEVIHHGLKLPLPGFAAVVHVDVTPDLRSAKVYVRVAGTEKDRSKAEDLLGQQRPQIQRKVSDALDAKFCPVLRFVVGGAPTKEKDDVEVLLANLNRPRN